MNVLRACNEGNLRLVVLNACESRLHAEELAQVVHCVVSMNRAISDRAAIQFAASFYGALAFGRSVQKSFDQGVARLNVEGIDEADVPQLLVRAGVDASRVKLVRPERDEIVTRAQDPTTAAATPTPTSTSGCFEVERLSDVTFLRFKDIFTSDAKRVEAHELINLLKSDTNRKFVFRLDVNYMTSSMCSTLVHLKRRVRRP